MGVAFVEVEGRVELVLARQQFLQPRLVVEEPLGLPDGGEAQGELTYSFR